MQKPCIVDGQRKAQAKNPIVFGFLGSSGKNFSRERLSLAEFNFFVDDFMYHRSQMFPQDQKTTKSFL
jgi:hypothetical protein